VQLQHNMNACACVDLSLRYHQWFNRRALAYMAGTWGKEIRNIVPTT